MFDTIGRTEDAETGRRRALAVGLTGLLAMTAVGTASLWALLHVAPPAAPTALDDDDVVMAELAPDEGVGDAPAPPPLPRPEVREDAVPVQPDVPTDVAPETSAVVPTSTAAPDVPTSTDGTADGDGTGDRDSTGHGKGTGGLGDGPGTGDGDGIRTFHHSEVVVKRRVQPEYPEAAKSLGIAEADCRVVVSIDEKGVPFDVAIQTCPAVFHDSVRDALMRWRWYPARAGDEAVRARFALDVRYRLDGN